MGRDNVHPFPCGLQSKLLGWSADCRTPPLPGLNALASYRPSACCRRGSAGPSVGSETMGFIVDGIRPGRTPVRTEILKPVTNQVTTPPGSVRRSAMRSDTVLSPICGNPTQPDGIRRNGMHGKEKVYGSVTGLQLERHDSKNQTMGSEGRWGLTAAPRHGCPRGRLPTQRATPAWARCSAPA
jgi:hypothetical protein